MERIVSEWERETVARINKEYAEAQAAKAAKVTTPVATPKTNKCPKCGTYCYGDCTANRIDRGLRTNNKRKINYFR